MRRSVRGSSGVFVLAAGSSDGGALGSAVWPEPEELDVAQAAEKAKKPRQSNDESRMGFILSHR